MSFARSVLLHETQFNFLFKSANGKGHFGEATFRSVLLKASSRPVMPNLRANIYVAPPVSFKGPKGVDGAWSPISSTLIHGEKEAVLVDTPITIAQNEDLAAWVEKQLAPEVTGRPSKKLTTLYITHGHVDHWAGTSLFKRRFPGLKVLATKGTIQHMKDSMQPKNFNYWYTLFPGQVDQKLELADPLPADGKFKLEGHELQAVEVGHSDTYDTTVLWVPSLKLAVCGDVVYGDVHQMLAFANTKALREEWIKAIEKVQALKPEIVVAGHKKDGELDGAFHLENTKEYIKQFGGLVEGGTTKTAKELLVKIVERYPTRLNTGALMAGCASIHPSKPKI